MPQPSLPTIKRLYAYSRNACAFPDCSNPLVDADTGVVTGRICHIHAQGTGGPRFDSDQSDEERHGVENLILLCPIHHDIIDKCPEKFPPDTLREYKRTHESGSSEPLEEDEEIARIAKALGNAEESVHANTIEFCAKLDHVLSNVSIPQLLSMVPRGLVPLKSLFTQRYGSDFMAETGLSASADDMLEKGTVRISLGAYVIQMLMMAWDRGYFMYKFYSHQRIPPPQGEVEADGLMGYLTDKYGDLDNMNVLLEFDVQHAISLSTTTRALTDTLEMFHPGLHACFEPHLPAWAEAVRSVFGFAALVAKVEDEMLNS